MNHANEAYILVSRSFYTIEAVDDVAMYNAELSSSVGDLITPGVFSTRIKLTVYKNTENITDKFEKIVWKKFLFDGNDLNEEEGWGIDKYGQKEIDILRDEFQKKVRIECYVYDEVDNEEVIVASAYLTLVDVNDLHPSNTPPENPKEGEVWLDTSKVPPVFNVFMNGKWVPINIDLDHIYEDIEKLVEDIKKIDDEIFNINQELGTNTILTIDNKKDYLWYFNDSLTSTNGISPIYPHNKCRLYDKGKFNNCVLVDSNTNTSLEYESVIDNTKSFTINMWIKPYEAILSDNKDCRLISTSDSIESSILCIYNASPLITNNSRAKLIAEFGNDESSGRQYKELLHNKPFNVNEWEMLTITLNVDSKEFKFFRNGEFWTSQVITKINEPSKFEIKRAGWFIENLTVLNDKCLELTEIKKIYELNKPFKDMLPIVIKAIEPENISMKIE